MIQTTAHSLTIAGQCEEEPPEHAGPRIAGASLAPLTLAAKPVFDRFLGIAGVPLSDYSFANNVVWQSHQRLLYALIGGCLCLFALRDGAMSMPLPPLGRPAAAAAAIDECIEIMDRCNTEPSQWTIRFVHEGLVAALDRPLAVDREAPDFVYRTADLIELRGVDFKSKRSDINHLLRTHADLRVEALRPEHLPDVARLNLRWLQQRQGGDPALELLALEEFHAIQLAVRHIDELGLVGLRLVIDGETEAFTLGERLLPGVANVMFEKSNRELRGAAQLIFRELCRCLADCELVNTGSALDCDSLASSKRSYRPIRLAPKFLAHPLRC